MFTQSRRRQKPNSYFQMKTVPTQSDRQKIIQKLGSSIQASIKSLQSLKADIMVAGIHSNLKQLIIKFQKEHREFMQKQKQFLEIEQDSQKITRLKQKIKDFLKTFAPQQIERKLQSIKQEHIRQSNRDVMQRQQQIQTQTQINKYEGVSFRRKLLEQQELQLKELQKLMQMIKQIAKDISNLVHENGIKLKYGLENMTKGKQSLQLGRQNLQQTNAIQQDTGKARIFLCCLITVILIVILLLFRASSK